MNGIWRLQIRDEFSAAHALRHYQGKCENMHGHNFTVEICVQGARLAQLFGKNRANALPIWKSNSASASSHSGEATSFLLPSSLALSSVTPFRLLITFSAPRFSGS